MPMSVIDPPAEDTFTHPSEAPAVEPRLQTSHPSKSESSTAASSDEASDCDAEEAIEMLGKLPAEIGMLLVMSGIAGILLPGPVGTPLLIAGGVTMWPKTFQPIERWFSRRFPQAHREGVYQIKQFVENLQNRFPD